MERDPFEILGIQHGADPAIVAAAYKALSKKYHPDLNPDDPHAAEKMKEVNAAYADIKAGNYKDEDYYHPERKQQTQTQANPGYGPQGGTYWNQAQGGYAPNPNYQAGPTASAGTAGNDYFSTGNAQGVDPNQKAKGKRQWTYNGEPMSFGKAIWKYSWNRWLKWALFVIAAVAALFIVYRVVTGGSLGKEVKHDMDYVTKSLTHAKAEMALSAESAHTLQVGQTSYQLVFPN